jgi:hypothetical protein
MSRKKFLFSFMELVSICCLYLLQKRQAIGASTPGTVSPLPLPPAANAALLTTESVVFQSIAQQMLASSDPLLHCDEVAGAFRRISAPTLEQFELFAKCAQKSKSLLRDQLVRSMTPLAVSSLQDRSVFHFFKNQQPDAVVPIMCHVLAHADASAEACCNALFLLEKSFRQPVSEQDSKLRHATLARLATASLPNTSQAILARTFALTILERQLQ